MGRSERLIAITAARFLTASNDPSLPSLPNFELSQAPPDPVVAHWLRWSRAHDRKRVFCSLQADLEKQMVQLADGFPQLEIIADDHRPSAVVSSEMEIDALVASDSARATAKEKLQSRVNAWKDADALLGYSASLEAEAAVDQVRTELAEMTWKTPASSLVGVTAKLHCLLEMENPDCVLDEAPWPQLLSILNDLLNLAGQIAPGRSVDPERQHG